MSRAPPTVWALVLNWRRPDLTADCVRSLQAAEPGLRILIVDNGSEDGSEERLRAAFPDLEVLQTGRNLGYGGGMNQGIRHALAASPRPEFLWLLNNDVVVSPLCLPALLDAMGNPGVGAATPSIRVPGEGEESGVRRFGRWTGRNLPASPGGPETFISAAAILLRSAALDQVGLFDQRFFMYWEDADLCLRLRAAGWGLAAVPEARIEHLQSASTGRRSAQVDRLYAASQARFFRRRGVAGFSAGVLAVGARALKLALRGELRRATAVLQGLREGRRRLP